VLLGLTPVLLSIVAFVLPVEQSVSLAVQPKWVTGGRQGSVFSLYYVIDHLVCSDCIGSLLLQVLIGRGCPCFHNILENVPRQPPKKHLPGFRISSHVVCLAGQLLEFGGIFIDKGELEH
jgi:hypothetical protein